jgi:redox-sensing transcriptional repressor
VRIVGAGNLGRALANYGGFASRGFRIAALLDCDPAVVGTVIARHTVRSADEIEDAVRRFDVAIGVIATPATAAQNVCNRLVAAGVSSILNFAPVVLNVPSGVDVRKVDLSIELQILAFHAQRRTAVALEGERGQDGTLGGGLIDSPGELALEPAADPSVRLVDRGSEANGRGRVKSVGRSVRAGGTLNDTHEDDYKTGAQAVGT